MIEQQKKQILAVDDNPQLLTTITDFLQDKYKVAAVTNANFAIKVMDRLRVSLFLLDIEMPGMDGYQLASFIRGRPMYKKAPILFLTSKSSRDAVVQAVHHGGNDYIVKPVNREKLLSKVSHYIG